MGQVHSILLMSNGHGEDIIGATLLKALLEKDPSLWVRVLPIVPGGRAYEKLPVKVLGPAKKLPSGGFMRQSVKNLAKDIRGGLLGLTYEQIKILRQVRRDSDMVIAVGDVLLVLLAGLFVKKPLVFLPTAKSEYISGHYAVEKSLIRRYTDLALARDGKTAEVLAQSGVNAHFVGNAMMDSFQIQGVDFQIIPEARVVGILPGSRDEAYTNMSTILQVVEQLENLKVEPMDYLVALAPQLSLDHLERSVNEIGWFIEQNEDLAPELKAVIKNQSGLTVKITTTHFGDVLDKSDIFIGLAGTANEQAVGMGKPLIAFPTNGAQFNQKFVQAQKKLLGDSISVVEPIPEKIAAELLMVLHDRERYTKMGQIGQERMGPPGGVGRMADLILEHLEEGFFTDKQKS